MNVVGWLLRVDVKMEEIGNFYVKLSELELEKKNVLFCFVLCVRFVCRFLCRVMGNSKWGDKEKEILRGGREWKWRDGI